MHPPPSGTSTQCRAVPHGSGQGLKLNRGAWTDQSPGSSSAAPHRHVCATDLTQTTCSQLRHLCSPHRSSQLWGESWQSTTLISVLPWLWHVLMPSLIEPPQLQACTYWGGGKVYTAFASPSMSVSGRTSPILIYDNSSPFRSGHVCSFLVFIFSSKASLNVQ